MGGCFSDIQGGKQAVIGGGTQQGVSGGGHNDAIDFFFKTKGLDPLYTQTEVLIVNYLHALSLCSY